MSEKIIISMEDLKEVDGIKNNGGIHASEQVICPVCNTAILPGDASLSCSACGIKYHPECWKTNLGCSTYGCKQVSCLRPQSAQCNSSPKAGTQVYNQNKYTTGKTYPAWIWKLLVFSVICCIIVWSWVASVETKISKYTAKQNQIATALANNKGQLINEGIIRVLFSAGVELARPDNDNSQIHDANTARYNANVQQEKDWEAKALAQQEALGREIDKLRDYRDNLVKVFLGLLVFSICLLVYGIRKHKAYNRENLNRGAC